ncbi:MAG: hypothetical protein ACQEQC_02680 [Elusimicrobiota bacterium]
MNNYITRKFKDELVSIYRLNGNNSEDIEKYMASTRYTRDFMNYPEIVNIDFTDKMRKGIAAALTGINHLKSLSSIDSRTVNVYHILRGALNFQVSQALNEAFGYKWHSSSYISSQRVLKEGEFEISEDFYRKFIVPDNATIYCADIVASGVSLDNALKYLDAFMDSQEYSLKNFIFFTIGCGKVEKILSKWHRIFKEKYPDYQDTVLCYLEGKFALAGEDTPLYNTMPDTDLLRNYKLGALLTPEFEYSQFEKLIVAMEACVIYDGGKKGFEPENHIREVYGFWKKQKQAALRENISLWDEYNARFPLDKYFEDIENLKKGSFELLKENKKETWKGVGAEEYKKLFNRFDMLWDSKRIDRALKDDSFHQFCLKKLNYLESLQKKLT